MKQNKITTIFANKGSGKTILATALAAAQDKPTIIISPIKNSIPTHFRDKINAKELDEDFWGGVAYIYYIYNAKDLEELLSSLMELEGICIVIDEIDFYYKNLLDKELELYKLINYGRHKQIDLIVMSRRLQDTPKALVSQTDVFFVGRIGRSFTDFEYVRKTLDKEIAESAQYLEIGSFIRVDIVENNPTLIKLPLKVVEILNKGL